MVGLLATAHLDDELIAALRVLVTEPADLTSTDAFVGHRAFAAAASFGSGCSTTLDRFGIAHAVLALGEGADDATVPDGAAAGQPARPGRRAHRGGGRAGALPAAAVGDRRITCARSRNPATIDSPSFCRPTTTVLAVMAAAVDVVEAAGVTVDRGDDARRTSAPRRALAALQPGSRQRPAPQLRRRHRKGFTASARAGPVTDPVAAAGRGGGGRRSRAELTGCGEPRRRCSSRARGWRAPPA